MLPNLHIWLNHFEYHSQHPRRIPPHISGALTAEERCLIANSLAIFQLGEQSEGRNLLRTAYQFARVHDAAGIARITELCLRERQQHAALLGTFMSEHDIPLRRTHWTDSIFRRLRQLAALEGALSLLLSAELIGIVYYRSLEVATGSQRLRILCRMLVADQLAHVGFESDLLLAMRGRKGALRRAACELAQRVLFMATAVVVWSTHRAVLRRGGYRAAGFLRACRAQYAFYLQPPAIKRATVTPRATTPWRRARSR